MTAMKKEALQNILILTVAVLSLGICGMILWKYGQLSAPARQEAATTQSPADTSYDSVADQSLPDKNTPAGQVYYAFQNLLNQPAFQISTDATVRLKGNMIKGTRQIHSDVDITNAAASSSLQMDMTTKTTAGKQSEVSHAAYYQGWYCTRNRRKSYRMEKPPETVLSTVTLLSDILQSASGQLEDMEVSQEGSDTVYRFTLPEYQASLYFCQLVEHVAMDTKQLKNVTGQVTKIQMTCRVSKEHILTGQQACINGKISKSLFTIPVSLKATSRFTPLGNDFTITPPDLEKYPVQQE